MSVLRTGLSWLLLLFVWSGGPGGEGWGEPASVSLPCACLHLSLCPAALNPPPCFSLPWKIAWLVKHIQERKTFFPPPPNPPASLCPCEPLPTDKREVWVSVSFVNNFICNIIQKAWLTFNKKNVVNYIALFLIMLQWVNGRMKQCGWVVVAKSLALVCTKDQNRFCFSIWNKKKKKKNFFPPKSPNEKESKKRKKFKKPKKQIQNKTENKNWTPFRSLEPTITQWFYTSLARRV